MRIKHTLIAGFSIAIAALSLSLTSTNATAQCLTSNLNISTGYDPVAGALVTPSNTQLDPKWTSAASPDAITAITADGNNVGCYVALPLSLWPTMPGSNWIMGQDYWGHTTDGASGDYADTFTRHFEICGSDSFNLVIDSMQSDDWISDILVDGVGIQSYPAAGYIHYYPAATYSLGTLSGVHTITIIVHNFNNGVYMNAIGINVVASVVSLSGSASLISEACKDYTCNPTDDKCDDLCFWKLVGNHIVGNHNILGTLDKDDIRIFSNGQQRGVVKYDGEVGIHQNAPNTTLDVDCVPAYGAPSGLELENLPWNEGYILVVDKKGFVYRSKKMTGITSNDPKGKDMQAEIDELKKELEELKAKLGQGAPATGLHDGTSFSLSPNPSDGDINATYSIAGTYGKAIVKITDNMGREIVSKQVESSTGMLHLAIPSSVKSGTLIVSLTVDGSNVASKQLSFLAK